MYDSRTDHPRVSGTHRVGHKYRSWRELGKGDLIDYGTPRARRLATPEAKRAAIAEGLDEVVVAQYTYEAAVREACDDLRWVEDEATIGFEPERMDDWEVTLLSTMGEPPEGVVWMSSRDAHWSEPDPLDDDEDLDGTDWTTWLTTSPREFFDAVGDGWVFDGPNPCADRTSGKAGGYMRVHELARKVGINTADMVAALRTDGEYVTNGLSYVALPTADAILAHNVDVLRDTYGSRTTPQTWAERMAALHQRLDAPAKVTRPYSPRPGAPRPGRNPFLSNR